MKTFHHPLRPIGLAVAIACGSLVAIADVAPVLVLGETITVTGTTDAAPSACTGTGTVTCSDLRSAIAHANGNGNEATAYDKIVLANGSTHTLNVARAGTEAIDALDNAGGDLDITTPMNIETADPAGARATIEGGSGFNDRLLQINAAVKLDNLVLTKGQGIHMNGGAIYAGDAGNTTINNSLITGNKATWDGDYVDPAIVGDTGTTEVQGSGGGIYSKGVLTITKSALSNNSAFTKIGDLEYEKNGNGGAIYASQATTIVDSTIGGSAEPATDGSSVGTQFGNMSINGAGIQMAGGNKLEVLRSTFSFNYGISGGGLNVVSPSASPFTITNSTISNNHVTDSGAGINTNSSVLIANSTIAFNKKDSGNKGSGLNMVGGTATLKNTLMVDNVGDALTTPTDANCGKVGTGDVPVLTQGGNLSTDSTCNLTFSSDQQNVADAKLDTALALNDNKLGSTFTHKLLEGSPAIDKAVNDGCPSTDQRGFIRPFDFVTPGTKICDIGAYEAWVDRNDVAIASMTVAPTAVNLNEAVSLSVQVANNDDGTAGNVALKVTLPTGVTYVSGSSGCAVAGSVVTCTIGAMPTMTTQNLSMELKMGAAGTQTLIAQVTSDLDATDLLPDNNLASASVAVTDPNAVVDGGDGGGCSAATGQRPVDPVLPLLAGLGLFGWALRRLRRN